ncbi:Exocyst complex component 5 [Chytridiales sp. JEL 0842]|nr:Exocyst complex component 5 [Chytridiales sp. JEL 0842]
MKDRVFFAREEVKLASEVVSRLLDPNPGHRLIRGERMQRPPTVGITKQIDSLHLSLASKKKQLHTISDLLKASAKRLTSVLDKESHFYEDLAIKLRKQNWIMQSRETFFGRQLYVDYGLRNAGSSTKEICEASFRWETLDNHVGFSVQLPHRKSHRVVVADTVRKEYVSDDAPVKGKSKAFWRQLADSQACAFETELFNETRSAHQETMKTETELHSQYIELISRQGLRRIHRYNRAKFENQMPTKEKPSRPRLLSPILRAAKLHTLRAFIREQIERILSNDLFDDAKMSVTLDILEHGQQMRWAVTFYNRYIATAISSHGKFNAKEYIDQCASKNVQQPAPTGKSAPVPAFQPKPLIRNFEGALDELLKLRRKVQTKIDDLEDLAQASENARRKKLAELNIAVEDVQSAFVSLESHLGEVGKTAIRIGEQLETIDKQRKRATEARDLIQYYLDFNKGVSIRLEEFRKSSQEAEAQTAIITRRLNAIAKEVDIPGTETAKSNIEKYCEQLEKDILQQFDDAYRKGNKLLMNRCAKILIDLNGGSSCVQTYVNQHEFFINQAKVVDDDAYAPGRYTIKTFEDDPATAKAYSFHISSDSVADEDTDVTLDAKLIKLYNEVRATCPHEWDIISAVFPNSISVMQTFIQRIFAQSIQSYLESILIRAREKSDLFYLRKLSLAHGATTALTADLHKFDAEHIATKGTESTISGVIDRCYDDLFVPYKDGDRYIVVERICLKDRFSRLLNAFSSYVMTRKKAKQKAMKVPFVGTAPIKESQSQIPSIQAVGQFLNMNFTGEAARPAAPPANPPLTPEDTGVPSVELMVRLLEVHIEALNRCRELSKLPDLSKNTGILFKEFIDMTGTQYLQASLEMVLEDLISLDGKTEPELSHLQMMLISNQIIHLIQTHFQAAVIPMVSSSPTIHRDMVIIKNDFMAYVESMLNTILQKHLDASLNWLGSILAKHKKTDFRPKDETIGSNTLATQPCNQACDFLRKIYSRASKFLDGENLEIFLNEIGVNFHSMLLDNMKKFTYSYTGGLILTKDLAKYYETITIYNLPGLNERFEMLRELGNLFIVKPENLLTAFFILPMIFMVVSLAGIWNYKDTRYYTLYPSLKEYSFAHNKKVHVRGDYYNIYIRLRKEVRSGSVKYYHLVLNGYQIDSRKLCGSSKHVDKLRKLGQRMAANLNLK